ncbi:cytochrome c oxidase assembly protein COX18, mitochondrial isoform X1 [Ammospiza caudacuta]|uniref:cytochrome c oxidase assembly protein COX18, mitochondrial isoform X1 n=2 Tax=Ammospiza caudacuta TaxID=2857398 RepID=UPI0027390F3B|nr:cytochrome c oxidase assembly protein COX18, mitochondrial isoform X1 [Ammospiza caudacuta]
MGRGRACAASEGAEPVGMWRLVRTGARAPPAVAALAAAGAGPGPGGHGGTKGWYEWAAGSPPVHWAEGGLAALQEATGLPCWAAIAGGAALLRTAVTLPLAAQQGRLLAKLENLQPEIKELAQRLRYEVSVRGKQLGWSEKVARSHFARNMRRIVTELYIRDNCHPFKATLLPWVQVPMWVCVSLALRNCSVGALGSEVQEQFSSGGALWFTDLTAPDSTWILPVSLGLVNLLVVEIFASQTKMPVSRIQRLVTNFFRAVSVVMIPIAATVPSSMALYWLSSSLLGLSHNLLLRSPAFRRLCRIPRTPSHSDTPYRDMLAALASKYSFRKQHL